MWKKVLVTVMVTVMATMLMGTSAMATTIDGSNSMYPLVTELANQAHFGFTITGSDSQTGINEVEAGKIDIGMSSRDKLPTDPADLVFTKICKDPFAIIIYPGNPVQHLTQQQVQDIYAGKIINWSTVGGPNMPIRVYTCENGDTLDFFKSFFMGTTPIVSTAVVENGSQPMHDAVYNDPSAIGFVPMLYLLLTPPVKALPLQFTGTTNYYAPNINNCKSGLYKSMRNFNLVTKGQPTVNASIFIGWILTPAGQTYVEQDGEVPL